ncbi:ribonuclease III [Candidatus Saccharibacteria bacterium]|nr:ribonuclease III [Candidatus Saccharibacteria bacterium]MBQ6410186.1 ribonuclease III [Candidatus Saccharibacteria bacterium]
MNGIDVKPYQEFARERLGFEFNDIALLVTALTHRSYVNEHRSNNVHHNERLEYLGDAVLELVSSDFLYRRYNESEGIMTALRSALVRTESIGAAGFELGYEPLVRLSKGEKQGSARAHEVIMADCFEAVIGAIYLDQGYDTAKAFIDKHILSKIDTIIEEGTWRDPKSYVQELSQKVDGATPTYRTLREDGPDHDKHFAVGMYINGELFSSGEGHSKQEAQTEAAKEGVKKFRQKLGPEVDRFKKNIHTEQ